MKIDVYGAGSWGTALAVRWAGNAQHHVQLIAHRSAHASAMQSQRCNAQYLPGIAFPVALNIAPQVRDDCDVLVLAVPTAALSEALRSLVNFQNRPIIALCKGFVGEGAQLPSEVITEHWRASAAMLSGPSFAQEVAQGLPTAVALAATDTAFANTMAQALRDDALRIYPTTDVIGVEIGGAVKNVLAIAAGLCDGLQLGHNARAGLITRGLAEVSRLGLALGAQAQTFAGLAGMGDLVLTCTGDLSRNRRVGLALAKGIALPEIIAQLGHVAEGVPAAQKTLFLAKKYGIEMPICAAVAALLEGACTPKQAVAALMQRDISLIAH